MCVLFVDDESFLREIVSEYLTGHGFAVITACDSEEAFDLIDHPPQRFTVLLTDYTMPGLYNGRDVAEHMRAAHPHVCIVIVTGRPDLVRNADGAVPDYVVMSKPFELKGLAERLAGMQDRAGP